MHRIDTPNARADANGAGKAGYHLNTDMSGVDPTSLDPAALNALQEEVCTVIEQAEVELEKGTNNQLLVALQLLFAALGGSSSQIFSVANAVGDANAVNKLQLDNASLALAISLAAEITNRTNAITALSSGFAFTVGANQWHFKTPTWLGGFIIKGGHKDGSTANGAAIPFDVAFPHTCFIVLPMPNGEYDNTYAEVVNIEDKTAASFEWHGSLVGAGTSNVTGDWIAFGW